MVRSSLSSPSHRNPTSDAMDQHGAAIALKAVLNILDKWACSEKEKTALLGIGRSTLHKYARDPMSARVSRDLLERLSYILNIHAGLRTIFGLPETVYSWVRKPNQHPWFAGRSAIEVMAQGRVADLYEVYRHIDSTRGGWW